MKITRLTLLSLCWLSAVISFSSCNQKEKQTSGQESLVLEQKGEEEVPYRIPAEPDTTIYIKTLGNSIQQMRYSTNEIQVKANSRVKVVLENQAVDSAMVHNIVFVKKNSLEKVANRAITAGKEQAFVPDLPAVFSGSELAEPGETVEMFFTAPFQSGKYAFVCTYPGHWQEMNGRLIVEAVAE